MYDCSNVSSVCVLRMTSNWNVMWYDDLASEVWQRAHTQRTHIRISTQTHRIRIRFPTKCLFAYSLRISLELALPSELIPLIKLFRLIWWFFSTCFESKSESEQTHVFERWNLMCEDVRAATMCFQILYKLVVSSVTRALQSLNFDFTSRYISQMDSHSQSQIVVLSIWHGFNVRFK